MGRDDEFRYGDNNTIHRTSKVNVETDDDGNVVSVWFRCMLLPFTQSEAGPTRATDMRRAYTGNVRSIRAVVFEEPALGVKKAMIEAVTSESILEEALRLTTGARNADYGHPLDDFTKTAAMLSALFADKLKAPFTAEDVPKIQILVKLSRSMNTYKRDNMVDVAGYANTHEMVVQERGRRAESLNAAA